MKITRAKGGSLEQEVDIDEIKIPDLWQAAEILLSRGDKQAAEWTLECWYLCADLLMALKSIDSAVKAVNSIYGNVKDKEKHA